MYIINNLNYTVNYYIKLVIASINLTCIIEPKYILVGIILRFDYGVRVIVSWIANKKRSESLTWKIDIRWELPWVVSCKTDTWEYRLRCIWIDIAYGIWGEPWVLDLIVSCKTDTWEYRLSHIQIDIDYGILVNLDF